MPNSHKNKNVVAYMRARCSNHEIRSDAQLASIRQWIESQNLPWKIVLAYRDDGRGITTVIDDIRNLLNKRGIEATAIVVESFTRFGRNNAWLRCESLQGFELFSAMESVIRDD